MKSSKFYNQHIPLGLNKILRYFLEVYIATSLNACKNHDRKSLYAQAEASLIKNFTGVDELYKQLKNRNLVIDNTRISHGKAVNLIFVHPSGQDYIEAY